MDEGLFLELTNKALIVTGILSIPILIPGLIAGVLISLFQAVTQISEQTLTFVPKLIILILSYLLTGPLIVRFMTAYTIEIIEKIPEIGLN
jgi:flagellar biosynthesis protein FliQ